MKQPHRFNAVVRWFFTILTAAYIGMMFALTEPASCEPYSIWVKLGTLGLVAGFVITGLEWGYYFANKETQETT